MALGRQSLSQLPGLATVLPKKQCLNGAATMPARPVPVVALYALPSEAP